MKPRTTFVTLGLIAVIGSVSWVGHEKKPQTASILKEAESHQFSLSIESRQLHPSTIEVRQGDSIELFVDSDEYGEFHVAGYELVDPIGEDQIANIQFTADLAGTFNLELHPATDEHEDIALGTLIVHAR